MDEPFSKRIEESIKQGCFLHYKINAAYVSESLAVGDYGKLVALVYLGYVQTDAEGLSKKEIEKVFGKTRVELNKELPQYSCSSFIPRRI